MTQVGTRQIPTWVTHSMFYLRNESFKPEESSRDLKTIRPTGPQLSLMSTACSAADHIMTKAESKS